MSKNFFRHPRGCRKLWEDGLLLLWSLESLKMEHSRVKLESESGIDPEKKLLERSRVMSQELTHEPGLTESGLSEFLNSLRASMRPRKNRGSGHRSGSSGLGAAAGVVAGGVEDNGSSRHGGGGFSGEIGPGIAGADLVCPAAAQLVPVSAHWWWTAIVEEGELLLELKLIHHISWNSSITTSIEAADFFLGSELGDSSPGSGGRRRVGDSEREPRGGRARVLPGDSGGISMSPSSISPELHCASSPKKKKTPSEQPAASAAYRRQLGSWLARRRGRRRLARRT
ncbi:zinc finger CCCH domain-containing protein 53 [Pyrus ussuriensis x Pyrus communis]|uniref:Zinc finger CCCH domain-containing protein 53 n=1 Tax=Pyrus ussuriensis x Pyrus communis TaxID=2448454 RepID=A0A5N5H2S8_9ROSA|nr:zinc finger CCCH domain-containing protein 53 [Pyrus ussuriensis x Pyrus communis]